MRHLHHVCIPNIAWSVLVVPITVSRWDWISCYGGPTCRAPFDGGSV